MPVTIAWNNFVNQHVRPALNDVYASTLDPSRINLLTSFVVNDLQSKGLTDITITIDASLVISQLSADHSDAWNLISLGIKYYIANDPVTQVDAQGTRITKDETLVQKTQADYYLHLKAYLTIHKLGTQTAEQFWNEYLEENERAFAPGASNTFNSTNLTLDERLALLQAEYDRRLELQQDEATAKAAAQQQALQDTLAEIQAKLDASLAVGDQKRLAQLELAELKRRYELENQLRLEGQEASNGIWTAEGQVTVTYVEEYGGVPMQNTVRRDKKNLNASAFGIPSLLDVQSVIGGTIDVSLYERLDINLNASSNITFTLYELSNGTWVQVGTSATDNAIFKSYSLVNTQFIRIGIASFTPGTSIYISANLIGRELNI